MLANYFWFGATLGFGWYVRHMAHYNVMYGSLAPGSHCWSGCTWFLSSPFSAASLMPSARDFRREWIWGARARSAVCPTV